MGLKISVLTPSYNSAKYLDRAIHSVLTQDYTNWEHIIMDACSQDGTKGILAKYPHLIWQSEPDKGQSDAMNKAFAKCTGDIIVYLNADDYFKEGAFTSIMEVFVARTDIDIVVGDLEIYNELDGVKQVVVPTLDLSEMLQLYQGFIFPANPVSYFYKKKVQDEIGLFPLNNHYTMDYWFLLRAFAKFKVHKLDSVLGTFFMYGTNKTSDKVLSNTYLFTTALEYIQSDSLFNPLTWSEEIISLLHKNYVILESHYRDLEVGYRDLEVGYRDLEVGHRDLESNYRTLEEGHYELENINIGLNQELLAIKNTKIWKFRTFIKSLLNK